MLRISPVALPGVAYVRVGDLSLVRLLVQEIKHVFDGQRESAAAMGRTEYSLKQIVHKLLQCALKTPHTRVYNMFQ